VIALLEYREHDALGLSELILRREMSAGEVQEAALRALEEVNPALNAIVGEVFDEPLEHASDGAFAGVPMMLKDLGAHAAGVPMQAGSRLTGDGIVQPCDAQVVARFRAAGLAILGRTTTPEFGWCGTTEPLLTGPTRNPWDPSRSTSGSSGGSAALVAARAVPIAHGNDAGGSIRMPAAWCGLVGLKPSRGRVPEDPAADPSPDFMSVGVEFAMTRSVRDAAALLDALQGPAAGELYAVATPARPYGDEIRTAGRALRVALAPTGWSPGPVAPEHEAAALAVGDQLASHGHHVDLATPVFAYEALLDAYVRLSSVFLAYSIDKLSAVTGRDPADGMLEATICRYAQLGRELRALDVCAAHGILASTRRSIAAFFEQYDLIVTPTMTDAACPLGTLDANDPTLDPYAWQRRSFVFAPFTWPFNVTGQPSISLPLAETSSGLPIGVQLIGRLGDDGTVLKTAAQLEEQMPWRDRMPRVVVGKDRTVPSAMS
jgi:amidase